MNTFARSFIAAAMLYACLNVPEIRAEVIFSEDFESGTLGERWERYSEDPALSGFEERDSLVHSGKKSFRINAVVSKAKESTSRGHPYRESDSWIRSWLIPGHDRLFVRFYAMFAGDFNPGSGFHWLGIAGFRADNPRSMLGHAGQKPDGTDRFSASLEPVPVEGGRSPGKIAFYNYWPDMKQSSDGRYWGNYFFPETPFYPELGKWHRYEVMVKVNDPGKNNGEHALWIDGKKIMHFDNFRWRDDDSLKLNFMQLGLYIGRCRRDCVFWVDDLVVSTDYIGPLE